MDRYAALARMYEAQKRQDTRHRIYARHVITAPDLLKQLFMLAELTADVRFADAARAVIDLDLVDGRATWRRDIPHHLFAPMYKQWDDLAFVSVEHFLSIGLSRRLAFAETVVELRLAANSFDAAVKYVQRLWKAYKAEVRSTDEVKRQISIADQLQRERDRFLRMRERLDSKAMITDKVR